VTAPADLHGARGVIMICRSATTGAAMR